MGIVALPLGNTTVTNIVIANLAYINIPRLCFVLSARA